VLGILPSQPTSSDIVNQGPPSHEEAESAPDNAPVAKGWPGGVPPQTRKPPKRLAHGLQQGVVDPLSRAAVGPSTWDWGKGGTNRVLDLDRDE